MTTWDQVMSNPQFSTETPETQNAIRDRYFEKVIRPQVEENGDDVTAVYQRFASKYNFVSEDANPITDTVSYFKPVNTEYPEATSVSVPEALSNSVERVPDDVSYVAPTKDKSFSETFSERLDTLPTVDKQKAFEERHRARSAEMRSAISNFVGDTFHSVTPVGQAENVYGLVKGIEDTVTNVPASPEVDEVLYKNPSWTRKEAEDYVSTGEAPSLSIPEFGNRSWTNIIDKREFKELSHEQQLAVRDKYVAEKIRPLYPDTEEGNDDFTKMKDQFISRSGVVENKLDEVAKAPVDDRTYLQRAEAVVEGVKDLGKDVSNLTWGDFISGAAKLPGAMMDMAVEVYDHFGKDYTSPEEFLREYRPAKAEDEGTTFSKVAESVGILGDVTPFQRRSIRKNVEEERTTRLKEATEGGAINGTESLSSMLEKATPKAPKTASEVRTKAMKEAKDLTTDIAVEVGTTPLMMPSKIVKGASKLAKLANSGATAVKAGSVSGGAEALKNEIAGRKLNENVLTAATLGAVTSGISPTSKSRVDTVNAANKGFDEFKEAQKKAVDVARIGQFIDNASKGRVQKDLDKGASEIVKEVNPALFELLKKAESLGKDNIKKFDEMNKTQKGKDEFKSRYSKTTRETYELAKELQKPNGAYANMIKAAKEVAEGTLDVSLSGSDNFKVFKRASIMAEKGKTAKFLENVADLPTANWQSKALSALRRVSPSSLVSDVFSDISTKMSDTTTRKKARSVVDSLLEKAKNDYKAISNEYAKAVSSGDKSKVDRMKGRVTASSYTVLDLSKLVEKLDNSGNYLSPKDLGKGAKALKDAQTVYDAALGLAEGTNAGKGLKKDSMGVDKALAILSSEKAKLKLIDTKHITPAIAMGVVTVMSSLPTAVAGAMILGTFNTMAQSGTKQGLKKVSDLMKKYGDGVIDKAKYEAELKKILEKDMDLTRMLAKSILNAQDKMNEE